MPTELDPLPTTDDPVRTSFGSHFLVGFSGCDPAVIGSAAALRPILEDALDACGATRIRSVFHQFDPVGASGIILIAESHLSFHSWPEAGYMSLDVFTCGEKMDPERAIHDIGVAVRAEEMRVRRFERGL